MPISRENNLIFVHIPKNAGTSIQETFKMEQAGGHQTSQQMRNENPELWGDGSSFCVVRNPWDRMVSNYYYCIAEKSFWFDVNNSTEKWELADGTEVDGKPQHPLYNHVKSAGSFEAWMEIFYTRGYMGKTGPEFWATQNRGYDNQYDYLIDEDGKIMVDHVLRYENLNEDFKKFSDKVGLPNVELPTLNQSKKVDYRDVHTPRTREITYNVYKKEIELLNYKF